MTRWVRLRRLLHVVRVLAYHGFASAIARTGWTWPRQIIPLIGLTRPQRFRRLFEVLGGSFIKFGQMLALQPQPHPRPKKRRALQNPTLARAERGPPPTLSWLSGRVDQ